MSPDVYFNNFFNTYLDSSEVMYYLFYQLVEIHGVKDIKDERGIHCTVNDGNPDLFSAYAVHVDGTSTCIADASLSKLQDLRDLAKSLSQKYGWDLNDHTQLKDYSQLIEAVGIY